jgi:hypothetical protein
MPSPGTTQLVQSGSNWSVDSFFDITYRIDFVANNLSPWIAGRSGSTTRQTRILLCEEPVPAGQTSWGRLKSLYR